MAITQPWGDELLPQDTETPKGTNGLPGRVRSRASLNPGSGGGRMLEGQAPPQGRPPGAAGQSLAQFRQGDDKEGPSMRTHKSLPPATFYLRMEKSRQETCHPGAAA